MMLTECCRAERLVGECFQWRVVKDGQPEADGAI